MLFALAAMAVAGYVVGRGALQSTGQAGGTRSVVVANVLVALPAQWRRDSRTPIGNLGLLETATFRPARGEPAGALLIGVLPAGEPAPLPRSLTRSLAFEPTPTIVRLSEAQAYRYTNLAAPGLTGSLTAYAVPRSAAAAIVAVCFAPPGTRAFTPRCGSVVAGMSSIGQAQAYGLAPERAYAQRLATALGEVEAGRQRVAAARRSGASSGGVAALATELGSRFARAAAALAKLEPPAPAAAAHAALLRALGTASAAYAGLASTAKGSGTAALATARSRVRAAEALVNEALADFALLGYGRH